MAYFDVRHKDGIPFKKSTLLQCSVNVQNNGQITPETDICNPLVGYKFP